MAEIIEPFRVFVRIRPLQDSKLNYLEKIDNQTLALNLSNTLKYYGLNREDRHMKFDYVFTENDTNQIVFRKSLAPSLSNILKGYHTTVLCYGMTGAGKTHTMFGEGSKSVNSGLIYQAVQELFELVLKIDDPNIKVTIRVSFIEIYNETIKDLLGNQESLQVLEDNVKGVYIPGLTEISIHTIQELLDLIQSGQQKRTFASTTSNIVSSRSHALVQVHVVLANTATEEQQEGKLTLVDLAGSERTSQYSALSSPQHSPQKRQLEGQNINRSLLALGQCITLLQGGSAKFVPYRNSKLTRLLKQSLGGNAFTLFIACVSKSSSQIEETENTLRYALQARKLKSHLRQQSRKILESTIVNGIYGSNKNSFLQSASSVRIEEEDLKCMLFHQEMIPKLKLQKQGESQSNIAMKSLLDEVIKTVEKQQTVQQSLRELTDLNKINQETLNRKQNILTCTKISSAQRRKIQGEIEEIEQVIIQNMKIERDYMQELTRLDIERTQLKETILCQFEENQYTFLNSTKQAQDTHLRMKAEYSSIPQLTNNNNDNSYLNSELTKLRELLDEKDKIIQTLRPDRKSHFHTKNKSQQLASHNIMPPSVHSQRQTYQDFVNILDSMEEKSIMKSDRIKEESRVNIQEDSKLETKTPIKSQAIRNPFMRKNGSAENPSNNFSYKLQQVWYLVPQKENHNHCVKQALELLLEFVKRKPKIKSSDFENLKLSGAESLYFSDRHGQHLCCFKQLIDMNTLITIENFDKNLKYSEEDFINSPRSLEALKRTGVQQHQLLKKTQDDFKKVKPPIEFSKQDQDKNLYTLILYENYEYKRQQFIKMVREERLKIIHSQKLQTETSLVIPHCLRTCKISKRKHPSRDRSVASNTSRLYQSEKIRGNSLVETSSGSEQKVHSIKREFVQKKDQSKERKLLIVRQNLQDREHFQNYRRRQLSEKLADGMQQAEKHKQEKLLEQKKVLINEHIREANAQENLDRIRRAEEYKNDLILEYIRKAQEEKDEELKKQNKNYKAFKHIDSLQKQEKEKIKLKLSMNNSQSFVLPNIGGSQTERNPKANKTSAQVNPYHAANLRFYLKDNLSTSRTNKTVVSAASPEANKPKSQQIIQYSAIPSEIMPPASVQLEMEHHLYKYYNDLYEEMKSYMIEKDIQDYEEIDFKEFEVLTSRLLRDNEDQVNLLKKKQNLYHLF